MTQRHPIQSDVPMFITTVTRYRQNFFSFAPYAREAIEGLYRIQTFHPFFIFGFVIMPDHCHFLLNIPSPNTISGILNLYKASVSHGVGIGPLWQKRFYLQIPDNCSQVLRYIHANPIRKEFVRDPTEYPWSSANGRWDITPLDNPLVGVTPKSRTLERVL